MTQERVKVLEMLAAGTITVALYGQVKGNVYSRAEDLKIEGVVRGNIREMTLTGENDG